ncbi:amidohydrolase family protein [Geomicrobium sp. JCM 19039]|uniref:amidohydrolase family protein n=1 Tax=Geomicrobium sp. JCM 19039 TaxID=1460636 RepID=UPI00187C9DE4|nr:amidohydrolase family protein [Geomicrobium sp. JCM 19039]
MRSAFQAIGSDRLLLITDSMRAKGMPDGDYDLGGQTVRVHGEKATLEDGTLAGSVLRMNDAVRLMRTFTDASWEDVAKMTSWNQAKALNISDRKGNVAAGFDADVVLFGQDVLQETWCAGQLRFEEGSK